MFKNREEAGELLAKKLEQYKNKKNAIVMGLTRGGVVVSHQAARELNLPHDILVVKKIGAPNNPELAIGALAPKKTVYWDKELCRDMGILQRIMNQELRIREKERREREKSLRGKKKPLDIEGKKVILVNDGVATGATAIAASLYLQKQHTENIILAVPVISKDTLPDLKTYFDRIITLKVVKDFQAVGQFYQDFPQVEDEEVVKILASS